MRMNRSCKDDLYYLEGGTDDIKHSTVNAQVDDDNYNRCDEQG